MEYLEFYKLKEDPFGITPDPDYFYPSKWHKEALHTMEYFLKKGESFLLITGEAGTGKTTLIRTFLKNFHLVNPIVIFHSTLNPKEFIKILVKSIAKEEVILSDKDMEKVELTGILREEFYRRKAQGIRNIIIIDEAQDLAEETLVEIKHLSNLETEKEKLLHFILLAQPYFEENLSKKEYTQLSQRISLRVRLSHLDREEVESYIKFRLQRAGEVPVTFEKGAIKKIYKASKGIPRLINLICSRALMVGYIESSYVIKKSHVKSVLKYLNLKGL